jgi:hypothetical protein
MERNSNAAASRIFVNLMAAALTSEMKTVSFQDSDDLPSGDARQLGH